MAIAEIDNAPSRRSILLLTGTAFSAALLILFAGILPAEFHHDPLGLGRLTGTAKLWAPAEQVVTKPAVGASAAADSQSVKPVKVKLRLAGFYELVAPGQTGNEGELVARRIE